MIPEIKISCRINGEATDTITNSKRCADLLRQLYDQDTITWQEEAILLCLSNCNKVIGYYRLSKGGAVGTVVDPRIIFTVALNTPGTTKIILSHNHPSGNLEPSDADIKITSQIVSAGKMLQIQVLDHVIISAGGYYSFADQGLV